MTVIKLRSSAEEIAAVYRRYLEQNRTKGQGDRVYDSAHLVATWATTDVLLYPTLVGISPQRQKVLMLLREAGGAFWVLIIDPEGIPQTVIIHREAHVNDTGQSVMDQCIIAEDL